MPSPRRPRYVAKRLQELIALDKELLELQKPRQVDAVPDYGPDSIKAQKEDLENLRRRLVAIDADSWPTPPKVDYLLVWARLNSLDFKFRVMRPWARDPIAYLNLVRRLPWAEVPVPEDKKAEFRTKLQQVTKIMDQPKTNLTEPVGELANLTIFHLENFDGVDRGSPTAMSRLRAPSVGTGTCVNGFRSTDRTSSPIAKLHSRRSKVIGTG